MIKMKSKDNIFVNILFSLIWICKSYGANQGNMNGEYTIANPNLEALNKFSTLFDTYPNIEYFDVYSPPISTR